MLIYKITNTINGKLYIGQTIRTLEERKQQHLNNINTLNTNIYLAMRKYGVENFKFEIVCYANNVNELNKLETYYIKKYNTVNDGYNMSYGGDNNIMFSKIVKEKHAKVMQSDEVRHKISNSMKQYRKEHPFTDEHRKKLSKSAMGNHNFGNCDTRSVECYCIDENNIRHDFHNYEIAGKWWQKNYNPFNCKYNYATFRRKIIDCINTGKCDYGRGSLKVVVDNLKWFNK